MGFTSVPIHASYTPRPDYGASGTVTFTLTAPMSDGTTTIGIEDPIVGRVVAGVLQDSNGGTLTLYANDDSTTQPAGVGYIVQEVINGVAATKYTISVPHSAAGSGFDLATASRGTLPTPVYAYLLASEAGADDGVATLDGTGNVPLDQLGNAPSGGSVTITSPDTSLVVGGTTSAPTLEVASSIQSEAAGAAQKASNLSDLANAATARTNLELGTAATQASSAFDAAGAASTAQTNAETFATAAVATETTRAETAEGLLLPLAGGTLTGPLQIGHGSFSAPVLTGGGILYSVSGDAYWMSSAGKVTRLSVAPGSNLKPTAAQYETFPRSNVPTVTTAGIALVTQKLFLTAIDLPAGVTVSNISYVFGSTGSITAANWWFGLYDLNRVQLAVTADQLTASITASAVAALAIAKTAAGAASSFVTTYSGLHYLGVMVNATGSMPTVEAGSISGTLTALPPVLFGASDAAQTSPPVFPHTATGISVGTTPHYAYV